MRFQLDYVLDFAEPSESLEALSTVPIDMEEAYQLLLKRIEKRRRPTVVKILSWLFRAHRPLKQHEIREAIAIRLGAKTLSKPLLHLDSLIQYCLGLVTMDDTTEIVRFSHFTVKEFLAIHFENQLLSPIDCARLCLAYINFEIFEKGPCSNKGQYEKRRNEHRFSEYVTLFWGAYVKGEGEHDQQVVDALCQFFESRKKRAALRQIHRIVNVDPFARSAFRKIFKVAERQLNAWTPLHTVAHEGLAIFYEKYIGSQRSPSFCERLRDIELGTVHSEDEERMNPLLLACTRGHSAVASLIIADGADVMAHDRYGETSLHQAASNGHLEVVKLLLQKDAEINSTDNGKWTPLHKAAWGGHFEVTKLLLDSGAKINVQDVSQWTPLNKAASRGHHEVVKVLLDRDAEIISSRNQYQWSPVHEAASAGHLEVLKLLLDKDADLVNVKDNFGRTPLYEAANGEYYAVAEVLLAKNADVNAKDSDGETPLHRAALNGYGQMASLLFDNGTKIDARNNEGQTPLHKAALGGHPKVLAFLLDRRAEINAKDNDGQTPLHIAASAGNHEIVKPLLDRCAETFPEDKLGRTPLQEAASRGREVLNSLLAESNQDDNFGWIPLKGSSWGNYVMVISELCKALHTDNEISDPFHSDVQSVFTNLARAFAGDYLFWRTLGNEFLRQQMFTEAIHAYDTFVHKFVFRIIFLYDPSVGKFVETLKRPLNLECLDFQVRCQKCSKSIRGYHFKCKTCPWDVNYCQHCVQRDWNDREHPLEELLQIPSCWPLAPTPQVEGAVPSEGDA